MSNQMFKLMGKSQNINSRIYDDYYDYDEMQFNHDTIEEKVFQYRKKKYGSYTTMPNRQCSKEEFDPFKRILLEKAVQEKDNELLISLVNRHINPLVDSQTKDTMLHY